jgi:hypothetical protein
MTTSEGGRAQSRKAIGTLLIGLQGKVMSVAPKRNASNDRLTLLRFARKEAAAAAKASSLHVFSKSLRRIDQQARRIRAQAARGKIKTAFARRVMSKLDTSRRKIARLMATTAALRNRTLLMLDAEISRAKGRAH